MNEYIDFKTFLSVSPNQFGIYLIETKNQNVLYERELETSNESKTIDFAFGSVASLKDIKKNEIFTEKNIFTIRPGTGFFKVKDYKKILGKKAKRNIKKNVQLKKLDV